MGTESGEDSGEMMVEKVLFEIERKGGGRVELITIHDGGRGTWFMVRNLAGSLRTFPTEVAWNILIYNTTLKKD